MPTCSRKTSTTKQQKFEGEDPRIGQCGVIRVVRKCTKSTMFSLSSLLESKELCIARADSSWLKANPEECFYKLRLDALSVPHYVIKTWRCHGARHGKTEEQKEYYIAWNALKRCCKLVDSQGEHFTGIHDRFLRVPVYRESQLAIGWTEQKCKEWDELAQEDHTYRLTPEEKKRYQGQWYLTLNKAGKNGPMKLRSDFRAAVSIKNRLHRESGGKLQNQILQHNVGDGTLPHAIHGGTSLNEIGNELIRMF